MTADLQRRGLVSDLARRLQLASHDELRIVDALLVRLELGRCRYGKLALASDRRDWVKERREELLDAIVYELAGELAAHDHAHAELHEAAQLEMLSAVHTNVTPAGRADAIMAAAQPGAIDVETAREWLVEAHATRIGGPDPYESVEVKREDGGGEGR